MTPVSNKEKPVVEKHGFVFESADISADDMTGEFELVKDNEMTETKEGDMVVFENKEEETDEEENEESEGESEDEESEDEDEENEENEEEQENEDENMEVVERPPSPKEVAKLKMALQLASEDRSNQMKIGVALIIVLGILYVSNIHFQKVAVTKSKEARDLTEQVNELTQKLAEQEKLLQDSSAVPPFDMNRFTKVLHIFAFPACVLALTVLLSSVIDAIKNKKTEKLKQQLAEVNEKIAHYKEKERKRLAIKYPIFRKPQSV